MCACTREVRVRRASSLRAPTAPSPQRPRLVAKVVVHAVRLAGPRRPRGVRDAEAETARVRRGQPREESALAHARRTAHHHRHRPWRAYAATHEAGERGRAAAALRRQRGPPLPPPPLPLLLPAPGDGELAAPLAPPAPALPALPQHAGGLPAAAGQTRPRPRALPRPSTPRVSVFTCRGQQCWVLGGAAARDTVGAQKSHTTMKGRCVPRS